MKTLLLTALVCGSLTPSLLAQGNIALDNSESQNGIALWEPGNWYTGVAGIEVWALAGPPNPATINAINSLDGNAFASYSLLASDGFYKIATYAGIQVSGGAFSLGELSLSPAQLSTPGGPVTLALEVWDNAAPSLTAGLNEGGIPGVIAFGQNTTYAPGGLIPPPASLNWGIPGATVNLDLIMGVPEPSTLILVGLGVATIHILRRRR